MQAKLLNTLAMVACCLLATEARAEDGGSLELELESGLVWFSRNDVRIPSDTGTRFDMRELTDSGPVITTRFHATYRIRPRHAIRLTLAPLTSSGSGQFTRPVNFRNEAFAADEPVRGRYAFSTYRLTYRWLLHQQENWELGLGATVLVRDAEIALRQGQRNAADDDLGLVPLFHLRGAYRWSDRWRTITDMDFAAAPQGRAMDLALQQHYTLPSGWYASLGYRTLEGGADNDDIYTFAWLHYVTFGVGYRF
jgi:hypothetical protein